MQTTTENCYLPDHVYCKRSNLNGSSHGSSAAHTEAPHPTPAALTSPSKPLHPLPRPCPSSLPHPDFPNRNSILIPPRHHHTILPLIPPLHISNVLGDTAQQKRRTDAVDTEMWDVMVRLAQGTAMDNVAVDAFGMRHLGHGFHSNSL